MPAKLTREQYITKFIEVHGETYDYSRFIYIGSKTKGEIICKKHGPFFQSPNSHMESGCPKCARENHKGKPTLTTEQFIVKSMAVHGNRYDYCKSKYTRNNEAVTIGCPDHGYFEQVAINHLQGNGCPKCGREKTTKAIHGLRVLDLEEVRQRLSRFKNLSFPKLDSEYVTASSEITAICENHGEFKDTFRRLDLSEHGCVTCSAAIGAIKRRGGFEEIRNRLTKDCEGAYSFPYLESEYVSNKSKITAVCGPHGKFITMGNSIATGSGCPKCKAQNATRGASDLFDSAMAKSKAKYGPNAYTYLGARDTTGKSSGVVLDLKCNACMLEFSQKMKDHLNNCVVGCPSCANSFSSIEKKTLDFVRSLGFTAKSRDRKALGGYECDILIPEKKLIIEVNGLYWHSSAHKGKTYHRDKRLAAEKVGYRLVYLWEDEIIDSWAKVENYLRSILGVNQKKIYARKCTVKKVEHSEAKRFIDSTHFMGAGVPSELYLGLYFGEELVGISSYRKNFRTKGEYELYRSCYLPEVRVVGGLSKMVSAATDILKSNLHCYVDLDKFTGESYLSAGFTKRGESLKLSFVKGGKRFDRHRFKKENLKDMESYSPRKTASEILSEEGIYEIYESGTAYLYLSLK